MNDDVTQLLSTLGEVLTRVDQAVISTPVGTLGDPVAQARLETLVVQSVKLLQHYETTVSRLVGKVAAQCDPDLGIQGMASRYGHRNTESLLTDIGKLSYPEAARLVRNGRLLEAVNSGPEAAYVADAVEPEELLAPDPVAVALSEGALSPAQASEIDKALEKTKPLLTPEAHTELASVLVAVGEDLPVSSLKTFAEKKILSISTLTPAEQEERIRDKRYLTLGRIEDGLYLLRGLLDPESAALVKAVFDDASNPNRATNTTSSTVSTVVSSTGFRYAADTATQSPEDLKTSLVDSRTTGQKHLDRVIELITAGIGVNPNQIYAGARPAVKVITRVEDLASDTGQAWFEGIDTPVSAQTAERIICTTGTQQVVTDQHGIPLNLGRAERTFTPHQKAALTIRDGGCLWPGCDRPPAWCEAHHIVEWENGGNTDLDNGILLCRYHHMQLHNHGWKILPLRSLESAVSIRGLFASEQTATLPARIGAASKVGQRGGATSGVDQRGRATQDGSWRVDGLLGERVCDERPMARSLSPKRKTLHSGPRQE